jgi:LacI family transcriptional regulator
MESFDREISSLQYLTSRSVDGLIVTVSTETNDFSLLKDLNEKGMPIVFFDRIVDEIDTHKVIANNYKGAYEATEQLIKDGYKKIALVSNAPVLSIAKERESGYKAALQDNGISIDESLIKYCEHSGMRSNEVDTVVSSLMNGVNKPDAIFTASDKITTGVLRYLKENKVKVPEEVALIGFSNSELTDLLSPALSVVKQPAFEMGEIATDLLLQLVESRRPVTDFETRVLSTELIIRSSTAKK